MPVKTTCKYLGHFVGPGKSDLSWNKPLEKFKERVSMWKDQPLGLFWDARISNTFAIPVLSFVAQLEDPPTWSYKKLKSLFGRSPRAQASGPRQRTSGHSKKPSDCRPPSRIWNGSHGLQKLGSCMPILPAAPPTGSGVRSPKFVGLWSAQQMYLSIGGGGAGM